MELALLITAIVLLVTAVAVCWVLTLMGLPGNWMMVVGAGLYVWLAPATGVTQLAWSTVVAMAVLAGVGELAELAAGVVGARRAGGSRRAAMFALIGSLVGAVVGAMLGLPIPLFGPPIASLLGGASGALLGAGFAEHTLGEDSRQSFRVGKAAFVGRLLGTGAKTLVATMMAVLAIVALFV